MSDKEQKQQEEKASKKNRKRPSIEQMIQDAVLAGLAAGRSDAPKTAREAFAAAEDRIMSYHTLVKKVARDKEYLVQLQIIGSPERSKSIVRFSKTGVRLTPEEQLQAVITSTRAEIARNEMEADAIKTALDEIRSDEYYFTIEQRYFHNKKDAEIAEEFHYDKTTIWRNRTRWVKQMAVNFYGATALI